MVLIFGENLNDSRSIGELLVAHHPSLAGRCRPLPKPVSLQRNASTGATRTWLDKVNRVVLGYIDPVACILVHRDADGPDPELKLAYETEAEMKSVGLSHGFVALAVQELEAWWLLFPEATESLRAAWIGCLETNPGLVDNIADPKETLIERTRRGRGRPYSEADAPHIAVKIGQAIRDGAQPSGRSPSYDRLVQLFGRCRELTSPA